jgi:predicted nucleic acid-binding protein
MNVNETVWNLTQSIQESGQAIAQSAVEAQERNVRYVQSVLTDGVEVLKSHVESTRALIETVSGQAQKPQEVFLTVVNSKVAAQERNLRFAHSVIENGIRVLQSHAEANRTLAQELIDQSRKQQDIFQTLVSTSVEAYVNSLDTPFSYYKQVLDLAENTTRQGLENFRQATQQGLDTFRNVARQAREDYQNVAQ